MVGEMYEEQYHPKTVIDIFSKDIISKVNAADAIQEDENEDENSSAAPAHIVTDANVLRTEQNMYTATKDEYMHENTP